MRALEQASRPRRGRRLLIAGLALAVVVAGAVLLVVRPWSGGTAAPPATAAARTAAPPVVTRTPVHSDPSLATSSPADVPMTVLADAPGLPANLPPVALGAVSRYGGGLDVRLVHATSVDAKATRPGEISGPGVAVTVEITNGGDTAVSLDSVAVNVYVGPQGTPCTPIHDGATQPLHGSLAAGNSESATYVFRLPSSQRGDITITVSHGVGTAGRTAVFSGPIA